MSYTSSSPDFFHVGQRLTDYASVDVTVARTARGGFGAVAMGPAQSYGGKWLALKMLRPDLLGAADPQTQGRLRNLFLREALTWRGLWPHPNLLTAQFVTEIDGQLTLVLDYAEQGSLRDQFDAMRQQGQWFTLATALRLAQQIAAGLVALHTPDPHMLRPDPIVHRDLKPENILIEQYGYAQITDFGLAKAVAQALTPSASASDAASPSAMANVLLGAATLDEPAAPGASGVPLSASAPVSAPVNGQRTQAYQTRQGAALGTPAYMAPEQWEDAASVERPVDAYAFGIILAELLTSCHPLLDLTLPYPLAAWRAAHLSGRPIPLRRLGADLFAVERSQVLTTPAQHAGLDTALTQLEALLEQLLAKEPSTRPTLPEAFAALQAAARALEPGREPYIPPDTYPHTAERERIFWQGWANTYDRFGLHTEALARIEQALQLAPHDPAALSSYGTILAGLGRLEQAEAAYRQALDALPIDNRQARNIVFNQLGNLFKHAGRFADAEDAYAKQVALLPEDADGWYNRGQNQGMWALAEQRANHLDAARAHVAQGLACAEQAVALNPNNPDYHQSRQTFRQHRDQLQAQAQTAANGEEGKL